MSAAELTPAPPVPVPVPVPAPGTWPKAVPLLVLAGLLAYCNSFNKAFVFDDHPAITANPAVGSFAAAANGGRPVSRLSMCLNYRLGGFNPTGYHAFNLGVHILAGLTLFGLVRRVLLLPRFVGRYADAAPHLAFAVALLWLIHPLQTQAVTYIVQRDESLMGLFYLFTLYAWVRGATGGGRAWYAAAVGGFALCFGCKEVAATLPFVLVLFDRTFLAASWRAVGSRWAGYLCVAAVWAAYIGPVARAALGTDAGGGAGAAGVGLGAQAATPWAYLLTQSEVILHYLRLSVWPVRQAIDYLDWPIAQSLAAVWPAFLAVSALLAASLVLLYYRPAAGFVGFWFFAILAPTSSVIPILDPAFEHRMYLSLASVAVGAVFAGHALLGATGWPVRKRAVFGSVALAAAAAVLLPLTYARNQTYRSEAESLGHAAAARPNNPRVWMSLAALALNGGQLDRADEAIRRAAELPGNRGIQARQRAPWLALTGRLPEAEALYREILANERFLYFSSRFLYTNLTWVRLALGKPDEAAATVRALVDQQPDVGADRLTLAAAELAAGHEPAARAAAAEAARLDPGAARRAGAEARAFVFAPESPATPLLKPRALWQAAAACLADGDRDPVLLDTLAMAYAWNGRFADAAAAARRGAAAADALGDGDWAAALRARLKVYEVGKRYGKE